jgi:hypothetical protein
MLKTLLLMVAGRAEGPRKGGKGSYVVIEKTRLPILPLPCHDGKENRKGKERKVNLNYVTVYL